MIEKHHGRVMLYKALPCRSNVYVTMNTLHNVYITRQSVQLRVIVLSTLSVDKSAASLAWWVELSLGSA